MDSWYVYGKIRYRHSSICSDHEPSSPPLPACTSGTEASKNQPSVQVPVSQMGHLTRAPGRQKEKVPCGRGGPGSAAPTPKNSLWKNKCGRSGLASMHAGLWEFRKLLQNQPPGPKGPGWRGQLWQPWGLAWRVCGAVSQLRWWESLPGFKASGSRSHMRLNPQHGLSPGQLLKVISLVNPSAERTSWVRGVGLPADLQGHWGGGLGQPCSEWAHEHLHVPMDIFWGQHQTHKTGRLWDTAGSSSTCCQSPAAPSPPLLKGLRAQVKTHRLPWSQATSWGWN